MQHPGVPRNHYLIEKLFDTVTELPLNPGTLALRKIDATQPPTEVPA
jgi:hypothetical protein